MTSGRLIKTCSERDLFCSDNTRIGFLSADFVNFNIENIWICELYKNINTGNHSLLIITEFDESWIVFDFE
jgi:hypothetical protein